MGFGQIEAMTHDGLLLAYESQAGAAPTFLWLGGYRSDMTGTKAQVLAAWAHERNQAFVRFDYSGHGRSGGTFADGTISAWTADALAMLDYQTRGPVVLVGSSMGGWIALLAARARPERLAGLLLIAPAADFTERLIEPSLTPEARVALAATGRWEQSSACDAAPYVITREFLEDGRANSVMNAPIPVAGPVRIFAGGADPDVPLAHVLDLAGRIQAQDLEIHIVGDGDHRLSRPQDLEKLRTLADGLAGSLAR